MCPRHCQQMCHSVSTMTRDRPWWPSRQEAGADESEAELEDLHGEGVASGHGSSADAKERGAARAAGARRFVKFAAAIASIGRIPPLLGAADAGVTGPDRQVSGGPILIFIIGRINYNWARQAGKRRPPQKSHPGVATSAHLPLAPRRPLSCRYCSCDLFCPSRRYRQDLY